MKLHILSDIHTEATAPLQPSKRAVEAADFIVLAGDIGVGARGIDWAIKTFTNKLVLYVTGNHEFYGGNISRTSLEIKKAAAGSNVILLDNDVYYPPVQLCGEPVRILGCTLWTDFRLFGSSMADIERALHSAKFHIADFSCITFGTTGLMTPGQSVILHNASVEWLRSELATPFDGKTVVITHHAPSMKSIEARFATNPATPAFASNLEHMMDGVDLWIHGHTHNAVDYTVGKCRVVCNPRGYVYETHGGIGGEMTGWNRKLVVEI